MKVPEKGSYLFKTSDVTSTFGTTFWSSAQNGESAAAINTTLQFQLDKSHCLLECFKFLRIVNWIT